jgi:tetratricopeptide (TPR) repeat protein
MPFSRPSCFRLAAATLAIAGMAGCAGPEERLAKGLAKAEALVETDRADLAMVRLEELNRQFPGRPAVHEALAFAKARAGDAPGAAWHFMEAAEADPAGHAHLYLMAARALLQGNDASGAALQYRRYLEVHPDDAPAWQAYAELERSRGRAQTSLDASLRWHRLSPEPAAALAVGEAFAELGNAAQARSWLNSAAAGSGEAAANAAIALLQLDARTGELAQAETRLADLDRRFPGALDQSPSGSLRQQLGERRAAEEALARAQAEQARFARELEQARLAEEQAKAREEEERRQRAIAAQRQREEAEGTSSSGPALSAAASAPGAAGLARQAADAAARGQTEAAVKLYWQSLSLDDQPTAVWVGLANAYWQQRLFEEAESCAFEALRRSPDASEALETYFRIARETLSRPAFLVEIEAARQRLPRDAELALIHAQALAGNPLHANRAVDAYREFLRLSAPGHPGRAEAESFLAGQRS